MRPTPFCFVYQTLPSGPAVIAPGSLIVLIGNSVNVTLGPGAPAGPPGVPELDDPDSEEPELVKPVELDGEPDPVASLRIPVEAEAPEEVAPAPPAPDEPLAVVWPELVICAPLPAPDGTAGDPEGDPVSHAETKITQAPAKTTMRPFIRGMRMNTDPASTFSSRFILLAGEQIRSLWRSLSPEAMAFAPNRSPLESGPLALGYPSQYRP